jgi:hypothetical protein
MIVPVWHNRWVVWASGCGSGDEPLRAAGVLLRTCKVRPAFWRKPALRRGWVGRVWGKRFQRSRIPAAWGRRGTNCTHWQASTLMNKSPLGTPLVVVIHRSQAQFRVQACEHRPKNGEPHEGAPQALPIPGHLRCGPGDTPLDRSASSRRGACSPRRSQCPLLVCLTGLCPHIKMSRHSGTSRREFADTLMDHARG